MELTLYNATTAFGETAPLEGLMNAPAAFTAGVLLGWTLRSAVSSDAPNEKDPPLESSDSETSSTEEDAPPPEAKTRVKKVTEDMAQKLHPMILAYLKKYPLSTAKDMLKDIQTTIPSATRTNLNSCLYTLFNKGVLKREMDGKVPYWLLK